MMPYAVVAPCDLHKSHSPDYTYCERHHIIPQAWQKLWQPAGFAPIGKPPYDPNFPNSAPSPDQPGLILWDARTSNICRTGHGNVHWWLVELMHTMFEGNKPPAAAVKVVKANSGGKKISREDLITALLAIARFTGAGGQLPALWAAHEWGAI